ncbi:MAG TPA: peptidoglycan DD-metalloendopeptidase family protein [Acidimicrobiia bacterium]|nr:peptidoglycan DD-metalloendopeptidase family protein [Acidimicrobiia bacterium]
MKRLILVLSAVAALIVVAAPASASGFDPSSMSFPIDGEYRITDSFGDCRGANCSRSHEGVDMPAAKGTPVVAAGDGVVSWISPNQNGSNCCYIGIDHGDGWVTRYIHLNDDAQDANGNYLDNTDGQGWGIADGLVKGSDVTAGQLIGWVGDSGNAAEGHPHLHFELRHDGTAIDPFPYLLLALETWSGSFRDDDHSVHEANIDKIFAQGITLGCNPPTNDQFCPERNITRGEMAAFIARALNLTAMTGTSPYDDVDAHLFSIAVDKIQTAGIGFGCDVDSFCPDRPLERDEMAELLVRAFDYENPEAQDFFTDDTDNPFHDSINRLAAAGITVGCNPPDNDRYCPDRQLTRAEMATFFVRSLDL